MTVKRILLIRHGETTWNAERRWQGTIHHVPLSETGRAQAQALAGYLTGQPIGSIYSSDLLRAWETATILGDMLGIDPQGDERLREINAGVFQGHTGDELQRAYPDELAEFRQRNADYRFPAGESWQELRIRVRAAFEDIAETANGPSAVIISHGGSIRELLNDLFPNKPELAALRLTNTSISTLAWDQQRWQLIEADSAPHLSETADNHANQDSKPTI